MSLASDHDALLLDLDGTVWEGGLAIEHAVATLNTCAAPKLYVTNNASKAPEIAAAQLSELGLSTAPEQVLTSAQAAISLCASSVHQGAKVLVLGTDSFRELARAAGFEVVASADDQPAAVLHGHNPETGWAQLSEAALAIRAGALYFASNLDTTLPLERGLHVGNGSMVAAVTSATGVTPQSAGKPQPAMFHLAAEQLGATRPLAIGDRLDTDIAGGVAAGMDTLQVLTGVSGHHDIVAAPASQRATYLGADMRALLDAPESLVPGLRAGFQVSREGENIVLTGGDASATGMDALLSVLTLAWQDNGSFQGEVTARSETAERALAEWR